MIARQTLGLSSQRPDNALRRGPVLGSASSNCTEGIATMSGFVGTIYFLDAEELLKTCNGGEIIAYAPDAKSPWWRLHEGKETDGAIFDRTVLKPLLPASIDAINAALPTPFNQGSARGHLAWALSRGYLTIDGKLVEDRISPQ
jgi:hypothetical protein